MLAIVGAELLAAGRVAEPGVVPPERAFDPDRFVAQVQRAGVRITMSTRRTRRAIAQGSVP